MTRKHLAYLMGDKGIVPGNQDTYDHRTNVQTGTAAGDGISVKACCGRSVADYFAAIATLLNHYHRNGQNGRRNGKTWVCRFGRLTALTGL